MYFNYIETNAGWGAECFVDSALKILGHDVVSIDYKKHQYDLCQQIIDIGDFDVVLLQRGDWFPKEILRVIDRPIVFWASELVMRCRDQDRLLYSGLFTDIFVHSATCEKIVVRKNAKKGIQVDVRYLLNGYDSNLHRKDDKVEKTIDILFIGSVTRRRQEILEKLKSRGLNITVCEGVYGEEFVSKVNSAKIVINIHSSSRLDTETRIFEVLGCGGFIVSEPLSEENPFIPGEHFIEANVTDFPNVVNYYLKNEAERVAIASCGHMEALNKHSYLERTRRDIVPILQSAINKHKDITEKPFDKYLLLRYEEKQKSRIRRTIKYIYIKCFEKYQHIWDRLIDLYEK